MVVIGAGNGGEVLHKTDKAVNATCSQCAHICNTETSYGLNTPDTPGTPGTPEYARAAWAPMTDLKSL